MIRPLSRSAACTIGIATFLLSTNIGNSQVLLGLTSDDNLAENNTFLVGGSAAPILRVGMSGSAPAGGRNGLVLFQLSDLGAVSNPFATADFRLYLASNSGTFNINADLYGLGLQESQTLTIGTGVLALSRFYESDAVDAMPGVTLIQQNIVIGGSTVPAGYKSISDAGDAGTGAAATAV